MKIKKHSAPKYLQYRDAWQWACEEKLYRGYKEYGDESFNRSMFDLIKEMQEEVVDLANWGMILWVKLEELKKKALTINS